MAPLRTRLHKIGQSDLVQRVTHKFRKHRVNENEEPLAVTAEAVAVAVAPHVTAISTNDQLEILKAQLPGAHLSTSVPTTASSASPQPSSSEATPSADSKRSSYGSAKSSHGKMSCEEFSPQVPGQHGLGTPSNPIDLTDTSSSPPVPAPQLGVGASLDNPIVLGESPPPVSHIANDQMMDIDDEIEGEGATDKFYDAKEYDNDGELEEYEQAFTNDGSATLPGDDSDVSVILQQSSYPSFLGGSFSDIFNVRKPSGERALRGFGRKLRSFDCGECHSPFNLQPAEIVMEMKEMLSKKGVLSPCIKCRNCNTASCIGCGVADICKAEKCQRTLSGKSFKVTWCCDEGRVYLIWALCCGVDPIQGLASARIQKAKATTVSNTSRATGSLFGFFGTAKDPKLPTTASGLFGVPHPPPPPPSKSTSAATTSPLASGVGYGGSGWDWVPVPASLKPAAAPIESIIPKDDNLYELYFRAIALLIPRLDGATTFDTSPSCPELLKHIFARSPLLAKAAELLRSTSMEDLTRRNTLYDALIDLLTALSSHPATLGIVTEPVVLYPASVQLLPFTLLPTSAAALESRLPSFARQTSLSKGKGASTEKTDALITIFGKAADLTHHILQQAAAHEEEFQATSEQIMLVICRRYGALGDFFDSNRVVATTSSSSSDDLSISNSKDAAGGSGGSSTSYNFNKSALAAKAKADFVAWHRANCLADLLEDEMNKAFYFVGMVDNPGQATAGPPVMKGRMKRLIMDINAMRSSLPEGIFVRHGSSRMDVMKILIAGPHGTPYQGGLFEFDLFCPGTFPQTPPLMRLKTTGGGRVRFNPNLYADGMVCLSLINTWSSGESWRPDHSTLLQVLVSIQGMIFCEKPWYNEPGREGRRDDAASDRENKTLQGHTIEHAMLYWLNKLPTMPNRNAATTGDTDMYVWEEVVRRHFAAHGSTIIETVKGWPGKRKVKELTLAMKKHGFLD